jgi:hypothetical protein
VGTLSNGKGVGKIPTPAEHRRLVERCRALPPAKGVYLVNDYVLNMILTVLDYNRLTIVVERAHNHFVSVHGRTITSHQQLKEALLRYPETKDGNTDAALFLWNYRLSDRANQLRRLLGFFESIGVTTHDDLKQWAHGADFDRDFRDKVPGLALAVFKWLVMRLGVETVKPDTHVRKFVETVVGRRLTDSQIVAALEAVAKALSLKAYELDWSIWESQRKKT